MSHGQPPHIQTVVPCECGSTEAYWHGPEEGRRDYCCDRCWRGRSEGARLLVKANDLVHELDRLICRCVPRYGLVPELGVHTCDACHAKKHAASMLEALEANWKAEEETQ